MGNIPYTVILMRIKLRDLTIFNNKKVILAGRTIELVILSFHDRNNKYDKECQCYRKKHACQKRSDRETAAGSSRSSRFS